MTPAETRAALVEAMTRAVYDHIEGGIANQDFKRQLALWEDSKVAATKIADALSAKLRELGLKIVPVEATEEMVSMGTSAAIFGIGKPVDDAAVPRVWSAMVDACEDVLG